MAKTKPKSKTRERSFLLFVSNPEMSDVAIGQQIGVTSERIWQLRQEFRAAQRMAQARAAITKATETAPPDGATSFVPPDPAPPQLPTPPGAARTKPEPPPPIIFVEPSERPDDADQRAAFKPGDPHRPLDERVTDGFTRVLEGATLKSAMLSSGVSEVEFDRLFTDPEFQARAVIARATHRANVEAALSRTARGRGPQQPVAARSLLEKTGGAQGLGDEWSERGVKSDAQIRTALNQSAPLVLDDKMIDLISEMEMRRQVMTSEPQAVEAPDERPARKPRKAARVDEPEPVSIDLNEPPEPDLIRPTRVIEVDGIKTEVVDSLDEREPDPNRKERLAQWRTRQ